MVKVEVVPPKPVENDVVLRMSEREARELMYVLMNDLIWDDIPFGLTTIADVHDALTAAGLREARR